MKYSYQEGVRGKKSRAWVILPMAALVGGVYVLINVLSPQILYVVEPADTTAKKLLSIKPDLSENRVYIAKINVDVPVVPINGNESAALEKGAVQRSPSSGNPKDGGNFVVAAHRFNLGYTPSQTHAKSPFYHINKLQKDDDVYVDYEGTRYAYKISERKLVSPSAVEIEKRTDADQLTLYSCELSGPKAGREVVIAKPTGKIVWTNGTARLQPLPVSQ